MSNTATATKPSKIDRATDAVRSYIDFTYDPQSAVDHEKVAEIELRLENADRLESLVLTSELSRVRDVSVVGAQIEADFIKYASYWAAENRVTVEAFRIHNVPSDVLRQAGFEVGDETPKPKKAKKASKAKRQRKAYVKREDVEAKIPKDQPITFAHLAEISGASKAAARKLILEKVDAGEMEQCGVGDNRQKLFQVVQQNPVHPVDDDEWEFPTT